MTKVTFYFLMIVVCFPTLIGATLPPSEREALIALYNSTDGDHWNDNSGWKTPPLHTDGFAMPGTEENWLGVTVSIHYGPNAIENHVTDLQLEDNRLIGTIPSVLGNLPDLTGLNLSWNQLSGSIPPELGDLRKLDEFNVSVNQLTGSIPNTLGNLSQLRWLNVFCNRLSGTIPPQLGNLSHVVLLDLSANQLNGSIPNEFSLLTDVQYLTVYNNKLTGVIPSTLTQLTKIKSLDMSFNCLSATDFKLRTWLHTNDPDWEDHQQECGAVSSIPVIGLDQTRVHVAMVSGDTPPLQSIRICNSGNGTLNWRIFAFGTLTYNYKGGSCSGNAPSSSGSLGQAPRIGDIPISWFSVTPAQGTNDSVLTLSIENARALCAGTFNGRLLIVAPNAPNSFQRIDLSLRVYQPGQTSLPFGEFSTPVDGSSGDNCIPVTGWALDDIGVSGVKIYNDNTYIGDADFVPGARPDVEAAYPTYPNNYKAGWQYLLLSQSLPNGGNGTYTLVAKATDTEGHEVVLGSKTITIDNAHAVKPFGAIDTPTPGGTVSGKEFVNFGWALTPQPNMISTDGSTIDVVIDGVVVGHPVYHISRSDIASLFPGYANSVAASGYFLLNTQLLNKNSMHTLSWQVTDNAGNSDGIGSRYFSFFNPVSESESAISQFEPEKYDDDNDIFAEEAEESETVHIEVKEMERVEFHLSTEGFNGKSIEGYMKVGDRFKPLPIGSTLNHNQGVFYWGLGPGFIGEYHLVFFGKDENEHYRKKHVFIDIKPKH
ncbi:MAG: hypothetical protein ACM3SY_13650 [Candidatus Omnitrophota bacterium]